MLCISSNSYYFPISIISKIDMLTHIQKPGGGIIGTTSAYYLAQHPSFDPSNGDTITLLEATRIAGGASGKAGGLLARWAYPACIVPLSFELHRELAEKHDGAKRWGYRGLWCGELEAKGRPNVTNGSKGGIGVKGDGSGRQGGLHGVVDIDGSDEENGDRKGANVSLQKRSKEVISRLRAAGVPDDLDWIDSDSTISYDAMGNPDTTAQVHPYQFTTSIAQLAKEKGVSIRLGSATSIDRDSSSGAVESVSIVEKETSSTETLPASDVVVAAGPWTPTVLPSAPISALRAHSVTIKPSRPVSAFALFTEIRMPSALSSKSKKVSADKFTATPEIYARPNDEVYACGEGDTLVPLPESTDAVELDEGRCDSIIKNVGSISDELLNGEVVVRQACYLPNVATGGGPLIGQTNVPGLFVASGHTCWGIQNGPATGKLISEFVWDGDAKSANVKSLDPRKFFKA